MGFQQIKMCECGHYKIDHYKLIASSCIQCAFVGNNCREFKPIPPNSRELKKELTMNKTEEYIQKSHDRVCQCKEILCNTRLDIHEAMGYGG